MPVTEAIKAVLIAGPTASGKSAFALNVADRLNGTIVNADAMQVYRELHIVSARPGTTDLNRAPHLGYGTISAATRFSVGQWRQMAAELLHRVQSDGKTPIFVGGTGLYFQVLLQGLAPVPDIPAEVRLAVQTELTSAGLAPLYRELQKGDPETAGRVHATDPQRILRGIEVLRHTGRPLSEWQKDLPAPPLLDAQSCCGLVISRDREDLYKRIDARLWKMLEAGALEEIAQLKAMGLDPGLPAMKALAVPAFCRHLSGEIDLESAVAEAQMYTRRYAKRQLTWLRRKMCSWNWLETKEIESFLVNNLPKMTIS